LAKFSGLCVVQGEGGEWEEGKEWEWEEGEGGERERREEGEEERTNRIRVDVC